MYKRLEQKIKDADYERDMQDVLEILNDKREKHLQSKNKIELPNENLPKDITYTEKEIKTSNCRLCKMDFKPSQAAISQHLESDIHLDNLAAYKLRYGQYIERIRKQIFKNKLSKHSGLGKLKFFRLASQFE